MKNINTKTLTSLAILVLCLSGEITAQTGGNWPQWRGSNRDGISKETGLLKEWPENGPALAWKATGAGGGYSSFAISNGSCTRWDCVANVNM